MSGVFTSVRKILGSARLYSGVSTNALSSIGNFAVSIAVARSAPIEEVGEFAIAFATYAFLTGLIRAGVCEPILGLEPRVEVLRNSVSRVSLLSLIFGLLTVVIGIAWSMPYLTIVGVTIHALSIFDYSKTMNLAAFNRTIPLIQEAFWTLISVIAGFLVIFDRISSFQGFVIWSLSGSLIGLVSAFLQKYRISPKWQLTSKDTKLSVAFGGDYLLGSGTSQISTNIVGVFAGLTTVGSLRAGGTLLGPVSIIVSSASSLAIPYLARGIAKGGSESTTRSLASTLIMMLATSPILLFIAFIPSNLGELILGASWIFAEPILPLLALEMGFISLMTVPFAGFRALQAGRATVIIRSLLAVLKIGLILLAVSVGGVMAVASAMAVTSGINALVWWICYFFILRKVQITK